MEFYETVPRHDLTYSDVFLVPSRSGVTSRMDVSLVPGDGTGATDWFSTPCSHGKGNPAASPRAGWRGL